MRCPWGWLAMFLAGGDGCGGEDRAPADTFVAPAVATASPSPLFEGLQRIAVDFSGADFTGVVAPPVVEAVSGTPPRSGDLEITEWLCNNVRCGVVLRVGKWLPPPGDHLPYPIEGQQLRFRFQGAAGEIAATVLMLPLHRGGGSSTTSPPFLQGTWMFAAFDLGPGVPLTVQPDASGLPGRIFVTGDVRLGAGSSVEASGLPGALLAGGRGGPGGGDGSAAGDAARATGGKGGTGAGGGGGGGFGEPGAAGEGHPDPAVGGGAGGLAGQGPELDCLRLDRIECGGGGGGAGGGGAGGGGGGGAAALVSLGTLRVGENVAFRANGGVGADGAEGGGGGGGAGGALVVAAVGWEGTPVLEVQGGRGGAAGTAGGAGGQGGGGRIRYENTGDPPTAVGVGAGSFWRGPAVDLAALDVLTRDAEIEFRGRGEPGATVRVWNDSLRPAGCSETTAQADGTFAVRVPLQAGLNDFRVTQQTDGLEARSWTGTMFELSGRSVQGARIYVVRVPEVE